MAWLEKGFVTTYPDGHAEVYLHGEYTEELEKIIEIMRGIKGTTQPEAREA